MTVQSVKLRQLLTIMGEVWVAGMEMRDPDGVNSEAAVDMGKVDTEAAGNLAV